MVSAGIPIHRTRRVRSRLRRFKCSGLVISAGDSKPFGASIGSYFEESVPDALEDKGGAVIGEGLVNGSLGRADI
jgi:hypothetical protein